MTFDINLLNSFFLFIEISLKGKKGMTSAQVFVLLMTAVAFIAIAALIVFKAVIEPSSNSKVKWHRNGVSHIYEERNIKFISFKELMMADWDLAAQGETDSHYTISSREEVEEKLSPDQCWALYDTPNEVHAFLLSEKVKPRSQRAWQLTKSLDMDLLYLGMCRRQKIWSVRVSPKPGRANDFVARFNKIVGPRDKIIPELMEILAYHDASIER
ncbi:hypothetical protein V6O07_00435 [Arthrospira platensis SPKY2]